MFEPISWLLRPSYFHSFLSRLVFFTLLSFFIFLFIKREKGWQIAAVELAEDAVALPRLAAADRRTVVLLGHETQGLPVEHVEAADLCVEIPMVGAGGSLNVAVAGSLVLYKLAGLV